MMYSWIVFVHVLAVFGFLLGHGSAAAIAFRLRGEREVMRVRALLDLSRSIRMVANVSLLVMLITGITAAFMGNWWGHYWIWASLGVLVVIGVAMTLLGSRSLDPIRRLVQPETSPAGAKKEHILAPDTSANQQLAELLAATHPMLLTALGGGGLALILWLMMFKAF